MLALAWRLVDAEISYGLHEDQWAQRPDPPRTVRAWWGDRQSQQALTVAFDTLLREVDGVLCPAVATSAPLLDPLDETPLAHLEIDDAHEPRETLASWSLLSAVAQLPSVTIPAGIGAHNAMPVGLQVLGAPFADHKVLAVAQWVEGVLGGFAVPPHW